MKLVVVAAVAGLAVSQKDYIRTEDMPSTPT